MIIIDYNLISTILCSKINHSPIIMLYSISEYIIFSYTIYKIFVFFFVSDWCFVRFNNANDFNLINLHTSLFQFNAFLLNDNVNIIYSKTGNYILFNWNGDYS